MTVKGGPMGQMHMKMADGKLHLEAAKMSMTSLPEAATVPAPNPQPLTPLRAQPC
jgi:hypothetical protein